MATDKDNAEVKAMIKSLYVLANIPPWNGEVNEDVACVFGITLAETQKCSSASHQRKLSFACARAVIYTWGSALEMATQGIGMSRVPQWA